jgi:hypothetical protein
MGPKIRVTVTDTTLLIMKGHFKFLSWTETASVYIFSAGTPLKWSQVSSGSIVSDYGVDDRAIGVPNSAGAKDFSSNLCVQTGSGAHPASCTMGTGGTFPGGVKTRPRRDADHSPPSSAEVENE